MIQKKSEKGDLENRKNTFLILGLVLALGLVYVGFELYATSDNGNAIAISYRESVEAMDEDIIATDQTPPPLPEQRQQQQEVILNQVVNNVTVNTDWNFNVEIDQNAAINNNNNNNEYFSIGFVEDKVDGTPPAKFAEEMPEYYGGLEAMYEYLRKNIVYPEVARQKNIQGTVKVQFVVERDGSISNAVVISSLFPDCDQEAVDKILKMPKWKPARTMGKTIRCLYQLPVRFILGR